jgi:hypothetical protein
MPRSLGSPCSHSPAREMLLPTIVRKLANALFKGHAEVALESNRSEVFSSSKEEVLEEKLVIIKFAEEQNR